MKMLLSAKETAGHNIITAKTIVANAKEKGNIIDATQGRRTRCVIICDDHVILSALMPDTIANRIGDNSLKEELEND